LDGKNNKKRGKKKNEEKERSFVLKRWLEMSWRRLAGKGNV